MCVYVFSRNIINELVEGRVCSSSGMLRSRWKEELVADAAHKGNNLDTVALAEDLF